MGTLQQKWTAATLGLVISLGLELTIANGGFRELIVRQNGQIKMLVATRSETVHAQIH
jgi:hypothetical protein